MEADDAQDVNVRLNDLPEGFKLIDVVFKDQVGDPLRDIASALNEVAESINYLARVVMQHGSASESD